MAKLAIQFGDQIRERRKARGLTQAQLAEATSMSEEWIRRIERGAGSPSFDALEALALALGASVADLFMTMTNRDTLMIRLGALAEGATDAELEWLESLIRVAVSHPKV